MSAKPEDVDGRKETQRYGRWTFDTYRTAALDPSLTEHEKIGMPNAFREGFGEAIWRDISGKLPALQTPGAAILEIGPGCGELPRRLIEQAERLDQSVVMIDHAEMLDQLPVSARVTRIEGRFPEVAQDRAELAGGFDAILVYSVLQTVIMEASAFAFVGAAMNLLRSGGALLVGDMPNFSKLRRFLASEAGADYHRRYMKTEDAPVVPPFAFDADRIDDGMALGLVASARNAGFDAYLVPQSPDLPMANRREDLLILRP